MSTPFLETKVAEIDSNGDNLQLNSYKKFSFVSAEPNEGLLIFIQHQAGVWPITLKNQNLLVVLAGQLVHRLKEGPGMGWVHLRCYPVPQVKDMT